MEINRTRPRIGVIGNGFVGSAIVRGFLLDADIKIYDKYQSGLDSLEETVGGSQYIFVCVPTPMTQVDGGKIDLSIMDSVIQDVVPLVRNTRKILIIKSTVLPGTTQRYTEQYPGVRFCFCPEFLTARQAYLDFINAARHIFGGPREITEEVEKNLFRPRFPAGHFFHTDYTSAELAKYFSNLFFATKVAFCNEFYNIVKAFGRNYDEVKAMVLADGRIGNSHMDVPGQDGNRGFGGTCFPKDINAIIFLCEELGIDTSILKAVWTSNKRVREDWDWANSKSAVSQKETESA